MCLVPTCAAVGRGRPRRRDQRYNLAQNNREGEGTARAPDAPRNVGDQLSLRVVLVARHALLREGLRAALECDAGIDVVGATGSLQEAVPMVTSTVPGVVLVDSSSYEPDAPAYIERMRGLQPEPAIILLRSVSGDPSQLPAGAVTGMLPRTVEPQALAQALRRVAFGLPEPTRQSVSRRSSVRLLTERETQILERLARGLTNRAIAHELLLSEHTVKFHTSAIYRKLRVRSRAEAAHWARQNDLGPEVTVGD